MLTPPIYPETSDDESRKPRFEGSQKGTAKTAEFCTFLPKEIITEPKEKHPTARFITESTVVALLGMTMFLGPQVWILVLFEGNVGWIERENLNVDDS